METNGELKLTLDKLMSEVDSVFIVPHNRPDFDALGAAVGMSLIAGKKYKKKNYIIINDEIKSLPVEIQKMIEDISKSHNVIRIGDLSPLITDNSMLAIVDANKDYLVSTKDYFDSFKDILVIDHHKTDEHTIVTPNLFVDTCLSSTCEEISRLIFNLGIKINPDEANYLLSGIVLDTNRLTKNLTSKTFSVLSKLTERGANPETVNNLFLEEFEHDRLIQKLVDGTEFLKYSIGIAADSSDSGRIFTVEDIAKCADYISRYNVDAAFAIAYIDQDLVSISARSKGIIDVSAIMKLLGGGGSPTSAAARIKGYSTGDIKDYIMYLFSPSNFDNRTFMELNCEEEYKLRMKI